MSTAVLMKNNLGISANMVIWFICHVSFPVICLKLWPQIHPTSIQWSWANPNALDIQNVKFGFQKLQVPGLCMWMSSSKHSKSYLFLLLEKSFWHQFLMWLSSVHWSGFFFLSQYVHLLGCYYIKTQPQVGSQLDSDQIFFSFSYDFNPDSSPSIIFFAAFFCGVGSGGWVCLNLRSTEFLSAVSCLFIITPRRILPYLDIKTLSAVPSTEQSHTGVCQNTHQLKLEST